MSNSVIKTRRSYSSGTVPTSSDVTEGQIAVNVVDRLIYMGDNNNNVVLLGGAGQSTSFTGDATGSGSPNTGVALTLANSGVTAGTYTKVTVDGKGRVTVGANPTTLAGYGITDALPISGGTLSGSLSLGGNSITNLAEPTNGSDGVTKNYVDAAINGLNWKQEVAAATTANITLSGTQTIDGYAVQVGDRVLVKNQTNAITNGVYVVASGSWTRASDSNSSSTISGGAMLVTGGSVNLNTQWLCTNKTVNLGVDNITYVQINGNSTMYTAGTGLTLTGTTFSITNSGVTAGTYTKVTVNAQGQVTTGTSLSSSDVTTALGYTPYNGATNPNNYLTANQTITLSGDVTGSGTTAITTTLADSGVTPGDYTTVTVDSKGRVTAGTNNLHVVNLTATTANQVLDTFDITQIRSAKYEMQIETESSFFTHVSEIRVVHNGTTPQFLEYGLMYSDSVLATFDVSISGNTFSLLVTPINTNTTFTFIRNTMGV
jgi:phage-related tail fiber protein